MPGLPNSAPPPYPPRRDPGRNGFAIASLIFGVLPGVPLSVLFGLAALVQIRRRGQRGKAVAIAGLVLSALWTLAVVGVAVAYVTAEADRDASGRIVNAGFVPTGDLRPGDCLTENPTGQEASTVDVVPCTDPHFGEVYAVYELPAGAYPGDPALEETAAVGCVKHAASVAPAVLENLDSLFYFRPSEESWHDGNHTVTCVTSAPQQ
ncbi:DUF4190 domain-containing protein [Parafrankia sp. FMc2]|uniref:DUF4190 domain-containing protein n=1 Tax=Parafrankia sp. FMc2 TaxID=3233196 RepID=UPI0034D7196F